ncbi:MAG: glycerol-3-phosphate acyltransferase, partial [Acidimicrobiales bacterium]
MRGRRVGWAVAAGYLLGTTPVADLVARRLSGGAVDLRRSGSGNPGTANAAQVLGARAGALVLAGDVAKGAAACAVGAVVAGPVGAHVAGTASVVGHCYPVWTGFRGGKGVAASVGQCLATFPAYFPIDAAVAVATAAVPGWRRRAFAA